jgi:hypothetical protein
MRDFITHNKLGIAIIYLNGVKSNYVIDYTGDVYNYKKKTFLTINKRIPNDSSSGTYKYVVLHCKGKRYKKQHARLMAEYFMPCENVNALDAKGNYIWELDHKDDNDQNDTLSNFQWLTKKQNLDKRHNNVPF